MLSIPTQEVSTVNISRYCLILAILLLIEGVSALAVTVTPDQIEKGDQVTISIDDLPNNSTFSLQIEGTFSAIPGGAFSFETRNLVLPFSLNGGSLSATLRNTATNQLVVRRGDTEVKKVGLSKDGVFTTTDSGSIPAGTYDSISLGGTAAQDATTIIASLTLQGKKAGPVDSEITFLVDGVTDGRVVITITVDGGAAITRTILVGKPVTVTPTHTSSGGGGGGGGGGGSYTSYTTATTALTTVPTTVPTSPPTTILTPEMTSGTLTPEITREIPGMQAQQTPATTPAPWVPLPVHIAILAVALAIIICAVERR